MPKLTLTKVQENMLSSLLDGKDVIEAKIEVLDAGKTALVFGDGELSVKNLGLKTGSVISINKDHSYSIVSQPAEKKARAAGNGCAAAKLNLQPNGLFD